MLLCEPLFVQVPVPVPEEVPPMLHRLHDDLATTVKQAGPRGHVC